MDYYQRLLMELQSKYPTLAKAMETPMEFMEDSQKLIDAVRNKESKDDEEDQE